MLDFGSGSKITLRPVRLLTSDLALAGNQEGFHDGTFTAVARFETYGEICQDGSRSRNLMLAAGVFGSCSTAVVKGCHTWNSRLLPSCEAVGVPWEFMRNRELLGTKFAWLSQLVWDFGARALVNRILFCARLHNGFKVPHQLCPAGLDCWQN